MRRVFWSGRGGALPQFSDPFLIVVGEAGDPGFVWCALLVAPDDPLALFPSEDFAVWEVKLGSQSFLEGVQLHIEVGEALDMTDGSFYLSSGFRAIVAGGKDAGFLDRDNGEFFAVPFVLDGERGVAI
jgi:hypothetical protein